MKISNGIIFIWTGTNASIPSGWSRDTSFDDTYPKGTANATNPNVTGGSATHTHTSPAHSHTSTAGHTHAITLGNGSGGASLGTNNGISSNIYTHSHTGMTSGAMTGFSSSSVGATYASVSNDPLFYTTIYVTPTTYVTTIPAGIIALADATPPTGFNICDGTNSTPNLVDKYLKGASAGANAGTTGGSTTNIHNLTHVHTTTHSHLVSGASGGGANPCDSTTSGSYLISSQAHTHTVTLPVATPSTADTPSLTTTETVEPAYTKLLAVQAATTVSVKIGLIALYKGLLSAIPSGWVLCDGTGGTVDMRDRHLKITGTVGLVGTTGGSNTHIHASQTHGHAAIAHSHSTSVSHSNSGRYTNGSGTNAATNATTHAITTDSPNLTFDNASTTADSSNNEPPFRTVAFIKLKTITTPAAFIFNML